MKINKTFIDDLLILEPSRIIDSRGYFSETFRKDILENHLGYEINFVQKNESFSYKNVLRGIHFQKKPFDQSKLVKVNFGKVLDVAVDLRNNSKTFGKFFSITLSHENQKQLFIPKGFGHAFITLSKFAYLSYMVDNYYSKDHDSGIKFNDTTLGIKWSTDYKKICVSKKDKSLKKFISNKKYW